MTFLISYKRSLIQKEGEEEEPKCVKNVPRSESSNTRNKRRHIGFALHRNYQPGLYDVICNRNRTAFNSIGNRRFRVLVECHGNAYATAETKTAKTAMVSSIVETIESAGGKFITMKLDRTWEALPPIKKKEKVGHQLRAYVSAVNAGGTRDIYAVIAAAPEHSTSSTSMLIPPPRGAADAPAVVPATGTVATASTSEDQPALVASSDDSSIQEQSVTSCRSRDRTQQQASVTTQSSSMTMVTLSSSLSGEEHTLRSTKTTADGVFSHTLAKQMEEHHEVKEIVSSCSGVDKKSPQIKEKQGANKQARILNNHKDKVAIGSYSLSTFDSAFLQTNKSEELCKVMSTSPPAFHGMVTEVDDKFTRSNIITAQDTHSRKRKLSRIKSGNNLRPTTTTFFPTRSILSYSTKSQQEEPKGQQPPKYISSCRDSFTDGMASIELLLSLKKGSCSDGAPGSTGRRVKFMETQQILSNE